MPQTQRPSSAPVHHKSPGAVELEMMAEQITSLAIGARKQTSAPKGHGEHQLRRDVTCGKNKCFHTILKLSFADLRDGESIDEVTASLYHAIHLLEEYAGDHTERSFEAYIQIETALKAEETRREVDYFCGDTSTTNLRELDLDFAKHERLLEEERAAIHERIYGGRQAVA
jgi:hypothetical protein